MNFQDNFTFIKGIANNDRLCINVHLMWILNGKLTSHGERKYWILTIWNYSVMKLYELITGLMKMTRQIWHRRFILPLVLETIRLKNESYQFSKFWWKGNQLCSYSCLTGDWSKRIDFRSFIINNNFFFRFICPHFTNHPS